MQTARLSDEQRHAYNSIIRAVHESRVKPWVRRSAKSDGYIFFVQAPAGCGAFLCITVKVVVRFGFLKFFL